jgi:hypothetical protein
MLNTPNNVKELRHFLGIVHYYRDMWVKRSEMLAPLPDLVGECGKMKPIKKNKTMKKPWRWDPIHQQALGGGIQFINKHLTKCRKPLRNVPHICTFGVPDQGQT